MLNSEDENKVLEHFYCNLLSNLGKPTFEIAKTYYELGFNKGVEKSGNFINPLEVSADIIGIVESPFLNTGMVIHEMRKLIEKYDKLGNFTEEK